MSYADDFTEEKLLELEKKINKVYSDAQKDLEKQAKDYFEQFAKRDEEYKKLVDSGEITKDEYKQWRLNQIGRGERINKMAANMAARATQANEVAMAYVNDATPTIYSLNRNHEAYVIEQLGHDMTAGGDFTLYNESSVRRMLVNEPEVMPYYPEEKAVARGIDLEYGQKVIKAKTTSGILQGKSVYKIADDLQRDITNMNRVSAVRAARTAITSAQNGGRQDTMLAAQKMGIKLRKRWVSAKDGRVRDAHGAADGQTVNVDEPFIVGGEKLMFPGDKTSASGWNLYNCRCGMRTVEKEGIEAEQRQVRVYNPETGKNELVEDMTYDEWAKLRGIKPKKAKAKTAVQEKPKFVPAKTVEEAKEYAHRQGVKYVEYGNLPIETINEVNRALETLPKDAIPVFVGDSKNYEMAYYGGKSKFMRKHDKFYGVSIDSSATGMYIKGNDGIWHYDWDAGGQMVGISSVHNTTQKITAAKRTAQKKYRDKYGRDWFFNETGETVAMHEMGHCYVNKYGLPEGFEYASNSWAIQSKCDMLKTPSEAWAEAWASYHTGINVDKVPDDVLEYIRKASAKNGI